MSLSLLVIPKSFKNFQNSKKKLVIIKNGDHSLSSPKWFTFDKKRT